VVAQDPRTGFLISWGDIVKVLEPGEEQIVVVAHRAVWKLLVDLSPRST
jgi:hypothetical protein